jgi:ERF superfamily
MQRSSDAIAALAAALAKAQIELENPEKSLTASIPSPLPGVAAQSFRYASLASGLDLARKSLGRQEIAVIQSTTIDQTAGLVRLTTTLAHASGEWLASEWPVCPVTDMATPHRMGAALTYARRYALFTLVGIAGEDDLDAPDLPDAEVQNSQGPEQFAGGSNPASQAQAPSQPLQTSERRARAQRVRPPTLPPDASEKLRRELICQLEQLEEPEALASWACGALSLKDQLSVKDVQAVEAAFTARLTELGDSTLVSGPERRKANGNGCRPRQSEPEPDPQEVTVIGKPVREHDRDHLRFVAAQPCLVCGRTPSDPHHIKFAEQRALGRKVSDRFTVPVCRLHHRELHRRGNERAWWQKQGIDPLVIAASLWTKTHTAAPTTGLAADIDRPANVNGSDSGTVVRLQDDETKPVIRPEAR